MKKSSKTNKNNINFRYLLSLFVVLVLFLRTITIAQAQAWRSARVLGEQTEQEKNQENKENVENKEETEQPEPTEVPERELEHEQEAEKVHQEVKKEIEKNNVDKVEISPASEGSGEGKLKVEKVSGSPIEKTVSSSTTSLINIQNSQAGVVSVNIGKNGMVTLANGGITVQTNYPVVVDPQTQTVAIKTPNGVSVINSFPSQALSNIQSADKPTFIQSAVLGAQNGEAYYDVKGGQTRKFAGLLPVTANVETRINAQNGSIITVSKPWYFNFLGFLFSI